MSIQIDSIDISGMKKADLKQLEEIFLHFKDSEIYWGRLDYFNSRMDRLEQWLSDVNTMLDSNDIVIKS